jgi:hypothetical protein
MIGAYRKPDSDDITVAVVGLAAQTSPLCAAVRKAARSAFAMSC